MKIDSILINAFIECAEVGNISLAARRIGITQSAATQRLQKLEELLGVTLFIRQKSGLMLTEAGQKYLKFAKMVSSLEQEVLAEIDGFQDELTGTIRVAAFSSVLRSVVIPSLTKLLLNNKKVTIEFKSYEVVDLEKILLSGSADLVISDYRFKKTGVSEVLLGHEKYVVINSKLNPCGEEIYLDHGPHDNATSSYFNEQSKKPKIYRRTFMGDVYGIIDGVSMGIGKAVMSEHLIKDRGDIQIMKGYKKYHREVILHHFEQPYYSKLWTTVIDHISKYAGSYL